MRHQKKKKFGSGMASRKKLLRTLGSSLVLYEKITTSFSNARAVKPYVEKAITRGKDATLYNRRLLLAQFLPNAVKKILEVYGPKYKDRKGGYLRSVKLNNPKAGDSKVTVSFVE